ncbi:MAG TPA: hypothetical protein ENJ01_00045 [Gammaproteobacteria bacterium]|nr:hypothetical protein [Gammaproteobacteria bacterium]
MPYLKIQTNVPLDAAQRQDLLPQASQRVAAQLGKPERYVMVRLDPVQPMLFAGSDAPTAYLELKSIGLSADQTTGLSESLCELMQTALGVPPERVYIEFSDAPRAMWGWNSGTF